MTRRELKIALRSGDVIEINGEYLCNHFVVDIIPDKKRKKKK